MSFLNATLILGTLAAIVPVVLHLIARREPKQVLFPSITFLTKRFESNRSRLRVRRWWLLAMRIAAIAALALALARPAIHQSLSVTWLTIGLIAMASIALLVMATVAITSDKSRGTRYGLAGGAAVLMLAALLWGAVTLASGPSVVVDDAGPIAIAIVVDNSPTSAWKTAGDVDRAEQMVAVAAGVIAKLPRMSRIAVLDRSATPASFSLDPAGALSKLESIRPTTDPHPIASRIDSAARLVRTSELENRHVLLLTDLAKSTWDEQAMKSSLAEILTAPDPVSLTLFDTGDFVGTNHSLSEFRLADPTPPANSPVGITVTLRSQTLESKQLGSPTLGSETAAGQASVAETSVTAEAQMYQPDAGLPVVRDGKVVYPSVVSVDRTTTSARGADASELLLTIPGLPVGLHHGRLRIVGEDAIAFDNDHYFTISVLPASSVLLVSSDDNGTTEAKVIQDAITASAAAGTDAEAEYIVERIGYTDLAVARLTDYAAVTLLDPPSDSLADSAIGDAIEEYVDNGGGLLVTLGPSAEINDEGPTWLPRLIRRWRVPSDGTFFQVTDVMHPATASLAGDTPWIDFRVNQYWQVQPTANDTVLIRYAGTDHPAMLARESKNDQTGSIGRIIVLTTPLPALAKKTRDWNRLFGIDPWPAWLLTRQSIDFLTGRRQLDSMTIVGTPVTIKIASGSDAATDTRATGGGAQAGIVLDQSSRLQVFPPDGSPPIPIAADASERIMVTDTGSPGVYWIKGGPVGLGFSANLADDAINLDRWDQSSLDDLLGPEGWVLATDPDQIRLTDRRSSQRISLTSPAMLLALLVFLLEQVLGNRFYRSQ